MGRDIMIVEDTWYMVIHVRSVISSCFLILLLLKELKNN